MPEGGEERAVFIGLKNDAQDSLPKAAEHYSGFHGGTADELERQLDAHVTNDLTGKGKFDEITALSGQGSTGVTSRTTTAGVSKDHTYYKLSDKELEEAGITSKGVDGAETGGTDPVDLVSGQLVATTTDAVRLGVLPLIVRRAYASAYAHGGLYGPGWASTLDIRLVVDGDGIRFLGEDAQSLDYGVPAGLSLGLPSFPVHGARWPLSRDGEHLRVEDTASGIAWFFPQEGEDAVRPLLEICDRNGNRIRVLRDEAGVPVELAHSAGYGVRVQAIATCAGLRIARLCLAPGVGAREIPLVSYAYDDAGRLVSITDSSGVPYLYEWDERDRICGWVDRNGHDYHYAYDQDGRVIRAGGAGGFVSSTIHYDPQNRITSVTDGLGHTSFYYYDRFQQVVKVVDPLGGEELIERDRYGNVTASSDALGNTARARRDSSGLPVQVVGPDGAETTLEYNGLGLPVRISEPNGAIWTYAYDEAGNLTRRTDPLGASSSYCYNERGALTAATDPLGGTTTFQVDAAGLPTSATDPLGALWQMQRDEFGRVVAVRDPTGATRREGFDLEGRLLWRADPAGGVVRWAYDPAGNLIERTDQIGAVTRFEYGPMGLRTATVDPLGARHTFSHDSELRLIRVTGPTGLVWSYSYDAAGRLVAERDFDGRELTYRLDAAGRPVERVNGAGELASFEYDAAGHLTRRVEGAVEHRYVFDLTGHMVRAEGPGAVLEFSRDLLGRPITESLNGRTLIRAYDAAGNLVRRTTPSGAVSAWRFDAAGNASALGTSAGGIEFRYDPAGREAMRTLSLGDVVLARAYDQTGRMAGLRLTAGHRLLQERQYAYRADGAVQNIADRLRGSRAYTLDPLGRVTAVTAQAWNETYEHDELGNLAATGSGSTPPQRRTIVGTQTREDGRTSYAYDTQGRLVAKRRRTLSGQVVQWSYTWDLADRLIRVDTPDEGAWVYSYDPLGRRSAKDRVHADGSVLERTVFTYDGPRLVEQTHSTLSSGEQATTTWDYEPNSFVPVAQTRRRASADSSDAHVQEQFDAIVADLVGTPTELVGADGTLTQLGRGDLWGRPSPASDTPEPCPLRFPGQYFDAESDLHYNLHRYYDPETAAYLSPDPLGLAPSPNPRAYIGNPLTQSDPLGLNGEGGAGHPPPAPNLSNSRRVPYGEDPMSRLAITARKSQGALNDGRNVAVYLYHDAQGKPGAIAIQSDGVHSERLGWNTVGKDLGIGKEQIDSIYTELQPCGPIYHNCDSWLADNFPGTPVSHSFDYGPDKAGQRAGINALKRALTQVRKGNLPT